MAEQTIGSRIKDLRRDKGWSQAELAEKLGVTGAVVSKWETGIGSPGLEPVSAMADLFGVSVDYLIKGREQETKTVFISAIEYYAKEDDPSRAGELNIGFRDEKGKTVADYIRQYGSVRLFGALCDKNPSFILQFPLADAARFALLSNRAGVFAERLCMPYQGEASQTAVLAEYRKVYCVLDAVTEGPVFRYREGQLAPHANNKETMRQLLRETMRSGFWTRLSSRAEEYTGDPNCFLMHLFPAEEARYMAEDDLRRCLCVLPNDLFRLICSDQRISGATRNTLFGPQDMRESVWYGAYPYLIHESYALGRYDLLDDLLDRAEKNNALGLKKREEAKQKVKTVTARPGGTMVDPYEVSKQHYLSCLSFDVAANTMALQRAKTEAARKLYPPAKEFGFVRILEKTVRLAVGKGELKYYERFVAINDAIRELFPKTYVPDSELISVARYATDPEMDHDTLKLALCVHRGVLDIDEVCQYNDTALLKKALEKYPLCPEEIKLKENRRLVDLVAKGEWREIFRSSVDGGDTQLAKAVIPGEPGPVKALLDERYQALNAEGLQDPVNRSWLQDRNPGDILSYTEQRRKELIQGASKIEEENAPGADGKSPEEFAGDAAFLQQWEEEDEIYFRSIIGDGKERDAAVKLCQKLEGYLRHKGYANQLKVKKTEDTLQNMIDLFFSSRESGPENRYYRNLLHKLRIYRNSLVHPDYETETASRGMNAQDLLICAEYICDLPV